MSTTLAAATEHLTFGSISRPLGCSSGRVNLKFARQLTLNFLSLTITMLTWRIIPYSYSHILGLKSDSIWPYIWASRKVHCMFKPRNDDARCSFSLSNLLARQRDMTGCPPAGEATAQEFGLKCISERQLKPTSILGE